MPIEFVEILRGMANQTFEIALPEQVGVSVVDMLRKKLFHSTPVWIGLCERHTLPFYARESDTRFDQHATAYR